MKIRSDEVFVLRKKPELLAPAGNMDKLKVAFAFGADAVYLAGNMYGLRAMAANFSLTEIAEAVSYAHNLAKKLYVSESAIFRLCKKLGLSGYSELKFDLVELAESKQKPIKIENISWNSKEFSAEIVLPPLGICVFKMS